VDINQNLWYNGNMITQDQEDSIYNALLVGMALEDAYIYAGLSPNQILFVSEDTEYQLKFRKLTKEMEFSLLDNMRLASNRQVASGKHEATAWLLEKLYPRYSGKTTPEMGKIELIINNKDDTSEIMEIYEGTDK
jgi:hypothetical protein